MTIAPASLSEMLASTRFEAVRTAIVARLRELMAGIAIEAHPGRLDINDYVAKAIVPAPGLSLGWTRMRSVRDLGGTFGLPVEWMAYIVAEDHVDAQADRAIPREAVAHAIGTRLLLILSDVDTATWGLKGLSPPLPDPEPEMRPIFTMRTAEHGTALYAVSWTQVLILQGVSPHDGAAPQVAGLPDGMQFELPEGGDIPPELLALFRPDGGTDGGTGGVP